MSEICVPIRPGQRGDARSPPFGSRLPFPPWGSPARAGVCPHAADLCHAVRLTAFVMNSNYECISICFSSFWPPDSGLWGSRQQPWLPTSCSEPSPLRGTWRAFSSRLARVNERRSDLTRSRCSVSAFGRAL